MQSNPHEQAVFPPSLSDNGTMSDDEESGKIRFHLNRCLTAGNQLSLMAASRTLKTTAKTRSVDQLRTIVTGMARVAEELNINLEQCIRARQRELNMEYPTKDERVRAGQVARRSPTLLEKHYTGCGELKLDGAQTDQPLPDSEHIQMMGLRDGEINDAKSFGTASTVSSAAGGLPFPREPAESTQAPEQQQQAFTSHAALPDQQEAEHIQPPTGGTFTAEPTPVARTVSSTERKEAMLQAAQQDPAAEQQPAAQTSTWKRGSQVSTDGSGSPTLPQSRRETRSYVDENAQQEAIHGEEGVVSDSGYVVPSNDSLFFAPTVPEDSPSPPSSTKPAGTQSNTTSLTTSSQPFTAQSSVASIADPSLLYIPSANNSFTDPARSSVTGLPQFASVSGHGHLRKPAEQPATGGPKTIFTVSSLSSNSSQGTPSGGGAGVPAVQPAANPVTSGIITSNVLPPPNQPVAAATSAAVLPRRPTSKPSALVPSNPANVNPCFSLMLLQQVSRERRQGRPALLSRGSSGTRWSRAGTGVISDPSWVID